MYGFLKINLSKYMGSLHVRGTDTAILFWMSGYMNGIDPEKTENFICYIIK
jgi:hypothetical protein